MSKYLKVIKNIDNINKKIALKVNRCNDCPLVRYDKKNASIICIKNKNNKFIKNEFILSFETNGMQEIAKIDIPTWCDLCNTFAELEESEITYYIRDSSVMISHDNKERNLPLYDSEILNKYSKTQNNIKLNDVNINKPKQTRVLEEEEDEDEDDIIFFKKHDDNQKTINVIHEEECSCCGGKSTTIIRNINNGMCDECIELYKDDIIMIKQAIINNFRLKRGIKNLINKKFKIIL